MIYEPREDSFLLAKCVKKFCFGKVLDVGTGSGIQAETALDDSDEVIGIDINPKAIEYCSKKFPNIKFFESDLFENVDERFDTLLFQVSLQ